MCALDLFHAQLMEVLHLHIRGWQACLETLCGRTSSPSHTRTSDPLASTRERCQRIKRSSKDNSALSGGFSSKSELRHTCSVQTRRW